ncbi:FAD-binding oxidoreductase [Patescibacteria group bacterium]|nr:FAD-binding oxidoreductase [Patescibacteria group bacterium]
MNLKEELKTVLKGEVEDSPDILQEYSRDASLFELKPRLVVFPRDTEDVKSLVRFTKEHPEENLSLTARAGGTDMTGGPLTQSIVVDMARHFNNILEIKNNRARVQPGVWYRDFEKKAAKQNLLLPCYPASKDICTLGGMVANNAGGEKTLRYGKTEDYVIELKIVLLDGEEHTVKPLSFQELKEKMAVEGFEGGFYQKIFKLVQEHKSLLASVKPKVSKNSAGYYLWNVWDGATFDLTKLFVGSQGTLGIITEITFTLVTPKKHSTLLVLFLYNFAPLAKLTQKLLKHKPESLESYDDHTLQFAIMHIPDFIKLLKGNIITLAFQFIPEFIMFLKGGLKLPKLVVLAEFTGDSEEEVYKKAAAAKKDLAGFKALMRITRSDKEELKYMTVRRQSFNLLRHHVKGKRTAPFIDDIIVPPETLPEFLPKLQYILAQHPKLVYTIVGHVGDGNFHIIPLMDLRKEENRILIPSLMEQVYKLVFEYGGSMTAEHNDGIIRTPFLEDMFGKEVVELFSKTKQVFDSQGIFNPGKKTKGDVDFALSHISLKNK